MRIRQQTTPTNNPEQYAREFPAVQSPDPEEGRETAEVPVQGTVTEVEMAAQAAVSAAEKLSQVSAWDLLRWGISLAAAIARRV